MGAKSHLHASDLTDTERASPPGPGAVPRRRLQSLDILRGATIAGMIIVNATAVLEASSRPVFAVLLHSRWTGFTAADAVFPAFITMVGASVAVSAKPGSSGLPAEKILWRAARLILLGLLLVNMFMLILPGAGISPRLPGVLQRIGVVYALTAFVYPVTSTRSRAIAVIAILVAYWGICLLPIPDGTSTDLWAQGHSFVCWVDRAVFRSWVTGTGSSGYDPEGIVSTIPAFAEALIGTIAGDFLRRELPIVKLSQGFVLAGAAGIALAFAWNEVFPISKPLWTSSFVLLSAGITLTGLGVYHYLYDNKKPGPKGGMLGSMGRNSIMAYALHYVLLTILGTKFFQTPIDALSPAVGAKWAALAPVGIFFVLIWAILALMDRRSWYLKI